MSNGSMGSISSAHVPTRAKPQFTVTLVCLPDDPRPPEVRLRQVLKLCLRGFRMKCTAVREVTQENNSEACGKEIDDADLDRC